MTPERWQQIKQIFESVRSLPPSSRAPLMIDRCGPDASLRADVDSLLEHHDRAKGFLESVPLACEPQTPQSPDHPNPGSHASAPPPPPTHLGNYEVQSILGRGGMGIVYLARDPTLDRPVAIKVIPDEFARDRDRLMRFEREARILASLNHPNIAIIHGLEQIPSGPRLLILEHIEGETLNDRLKPGPLPLHDALSLCTQIARGLEAAHARGVIHRDLKPDNIRITPSGLVKVLDFGLARRDPDRTTRTGSAPSLPSMTTEPGLVMGTPGYMSPEQARGKPTDERTDIFSLACILYACLTGRAAFHGETPSDCLAAVLKDEPDFSILPADAPPALATLLTRCLDKEPERRLPAMSHVRRELESLSRGGLGLASITPYATAFRAPTTPTTNLPRSLTTFVGRAPEIASIKSALDSTSLLTLTGAGGCGKTRLALRIAEDLLTTFPDGIWLAELASTSDPALVPAVIAAATSIKEEPGRPLLATLTDRLRTRRILLILDNCEHLLSAVGELAAALLQSCRELKIIATSREALGIPGEATWRVSSLSIPPADALPPADLQTFESVQLFTERARLVKPTFEISASDAPTIARICRRLDGIPLAIELAAARVKILSIAQIHDKLSDRFRLLVGGSKAALERHQTLRAAIDWSYGLLSPEERRTLRPLSVFAGGCTLEAAAAVCSPTASKQDEFVVLDTLTHLVDKSLLIAEEPATLLVPQTPVPPACKPPNSQTLQQATTAACTPVSPASEVRYRLLETVRQYARDKLHSDQPSEPTDVSDRHLDFFLALAETAEPGLTSKDQPFWLDRLSAEHENILAALDWCAGADSPSDNTQRNYPQLGLRLVGALARFWGIRGHLAIGSIAAARALARDASPTEPRAKALNSAGGLSYMQGDHAAAGIAWQESLDIQRSLGNHRAEAGALNNLGLVAERQGDLAAARRLYTEALAVNKSLDNRPWQAININNLANIAALLGDFDAAAAGFRDALRLNRELGNRAEEAKNLGNLGNVARDRADFPVARAYYADALKLKRELSDRRGIATTLSQVGLVEGLQGDHAPARRHIAEALTMLRDLGDKSGLATALEDAACLAAQLNAPSETGRFLGAASSLRTQIGSPLAGGDAHRAKTAAAQARACNAVAFDASHATGGEQSLPAVIETALAWLTPVNTSP